MVGQSSLARAAALAAASPFGLESGKGWGQRHQEGVSDGSRGKEIQGFLLKGDF